MDKNKTGNVIYAYPAVGENPLASEYALAQNQDLQLDYTLGFNLYNASFAKLGDLDLTALKAVTVASASFYQKIVDAKTEDALNAVFDEIKAYVDGEDVKAVLDMPGMEEAPETDAPAVETEAPEADAPVVETEAPETDAPVAPETNAPETQAPAAPAEVANGVIEATAGFNNEGAENLFDGDETTKQLDFINVRGQFENNPFVKEVQQHIEKKSALCQELIDRISPLLA